MSILTCAVENAPEKTWKTHLDAITDLCNLFGQWRNFIVLTSPVPDPKLLPSTPPTLPLMMIHPLTSFPCVSISTQTYSVAPTKAPHAQIERGLPLPPTVAPTTYTTFQHTDRPPRVTHPHFDNPISHRTCYRAPIPPLDNEPIYHQMRSGQGLANQANYDLSPSAASCRRLSNSFITSGTFPSTTPIWGKLLEHHQICRHHARLCRHPFRARIRRLFINESAATPN